jgi:hypothetical protein
MTLLERMDSLIVASRLDRLLFRAIRPRTFRWTPIVLIVTLVAGYVLMAQTVSVFTLSFWIGWLLFYGAFLAAAFLRVLGPRFVPTILHPLDERELAIKARAHAISGTILASTAMFGCFYMASIGVPWLWHPHAYDWFNLGFGIQAAGLLLPTWIASWLEPQSSDDHED